MSNPIVAISWDDAHGNATACYSQHEIPHAPVKVTTIGWLLREDAAGVSVANEYCSDGDYRGVTFIPIGMITARKTISKKPRSTKKAVQPTQKEGQ